MATTRITEKISRLVSSQLPEFIRTDNTTFVAFLEYYYKFLEQDQGALELVQNSQKYSDIDQTTDSFVNYFITNYAKDLPYNLQVNKPLLIKRVKDLYAAKGGTLSIETLFKILYDTVAQTNHPYDFVLRPSDGKWNLRTSIRVFLTSGSASDIKDRFLTFTKNNINYSVEILRVKNLTTNLYEVFYHSAFPVPFAVNDEVVVSGSNGSIFTGTIRPTTTDWEIRSAGTGFRVGQIFNVSVGSGIDTLVRIDKVNATGGIELLKFLNFGFNFTEDISIILSNALGVTKRVKYLQTRGGGFSETFNATRLDSITNADRYFLEDYVTPFDYTGTPLVISTTSSQLLTSETTAGVENINDASINFTIGAVARYPGQYVSTQGFVSEPDVRIQDSQLYQPFAYQVLSELDISTFYNIVKKLVHQAGTNLFVNRILLATADVSAVISVVSKKNVYADLFSTFSTLDTAAKLMNKTASDSNSVDAADDNTYLITKPLTDETTISDVVTISIIKPLTDDTQLSDDSIITFNKLESDSVSVSEPPGIGYPDYTDGLGAASYFLEQYTDNSTTDAVSFS